MLIDLFFTLRRYEVKTSLRELLDLLEALKQRVISCSVDDFYLLSRLCLVKDEVEYDKFDRAFADYFEGVVGLTPIDEVQKQEIPEEWLQKLAEKFLTEEERKEIEALGGFEELMKTLTERLKDQKKRHQGGNKWIGTGGTSPFGAYGYNSKGVRIGQHESRHRKATKVWDKREFKNFDANVELGTRNIKLALKRLRRFARTGAPEQLDLDDTISFTARNGGLLDVQMIPERHNAVKVLLFMDVGGSMDDHIRQMEELFSACKTEFKHLEYYYFHNCVYEGVWKDNARHHGEHISLEDVLHTYSDDYKLIFVGDASMSPYEIVYPGGSVEHWNEQSGAIWMEKLIGHFKKSVWLNPCEEATWGYVESIGMLQQLMNNRMYPLTLGGLDNAIRAL